jgi:putative ABC transport system permease protein
VLWIAVRTVRDRWVLFAGSFVALALGVGLVCANGLVIVAAVGYHPTIPGSARYAAAPVVVHADQHLRLSSGAGPGEWTGSAPEMRRVPAALASRLEAVAGVDRVVADRWFDAAVLAADGTARDSVGRDWAAAGLTPYTLVGGTGPAGPNQVVLDRDLAAASGVGVGAKIRVRTSGGVRDVTVTGLAAPPHGVAGAAENAIFFVAPEQSGLAPAADADAFGILLRPGADAGAVAGRIRTALNDPGVVVATGTARSEGIVADPYAQSREDLVSLLALTAVIAGFVAVFVVASTFAFTVAQRRREIALLRLVGATARDVRRMVFRESLLVGFLGSAAGCGVGVLGGAYLAARLVDNQLAPEGFTAQPSPLLLLIAFAAGMLVAALGVFSASRRAARVRPVESMREAAVDSKVMTGGRWFFGLLFLVAAIVLLCVLPAAGTEASVPISIVLTEILIVALTALGPLFLPALVSLLGRPLRWMVPTVGPLVLRNIQGGVRRTVSTAAPVMLTTAIAVSTLGVGATITDSTVRDNRQTVSAAFVVEPAGRGLPAEAVDRLAAVPSVDAATGVVETQAFAVDGDNVWSTGAAGLDLSAVTRTHRLDVIAGSLQNLPGNAVVLTRDGADLVGWSAGQQHILYFGDGARTQVVVAAVVGSGGGLPGLMMSRPFVMPHVHDPELSTVYVTAPASAAGPLRAAAAGYGGGVESTADWLRAQAEAADRANHVVFTLLIGMALLYSAIAIGNTLLMSAAQRRREVALLRVVGGTGRQVLNAFLAETLVVIIAGLVIGVLASLVSLIAVTGVLRGTDPDAHVVMPWPVIAIVVVVSLVVGAAGVLLPARIALSARALSLVGGHQ